MHVIAGFLVVAAFLGFGIYKAFIDPTYVVNVRESIDWTEACVDGDSGLEIDADTTRRLNDQLDVEGLAVHDPAGPATVVVFFLGSEEDAAAAQADIAAEIGPEFGDDVTRQRSLVVAHPGVSEDDLTATYGPCLVEVSDNKWGAWTGFETQTIGRPFAGR